MLNNFVHHHSNKIKSIRDNSTLYILKSATLIKPAMQNVVEPRLAGEIPIILTRNPFARVTHRHNGDNIGMLLRVAEPQVVKLLFQSTNADVDFGLRFGFLGRVDSIGE